MLHLTPEDLCAVYDLLRGTAPFKRWKLPPGEEVEFHAVKITHCQADSQRKGNRYVVRVAANRHHTLASATMTMAHEMIHLRLDIAFPRDRAHHGSRFHKHADAVCKAHSFDRGQF